MRTRGFALIGLSFGSFCFTACPSSPSDSLMYDVVPVDNGSLAGHGPTYCSLGTDVQGAVIPNGFCMRQFATVNEPRVLAFAPNGDLFVAAPSMPTAGGASGGSGGIVVLSDDNHDGVAELTTFAAGLSDVHGLAFGNGVLYFTTAQNVWSTPYATGQRTETAGMRTMVSTFATVDQQRWTHGLAQSPGGALYASQGVYSSSTCPDSVRNGTISRIDASGASFMQAWGFRNPMYMRCHYADEVCIASELGDDGGASFGAHEKLVVLQSGTDFGFPCCTQQNMSTPVNNDNFNCAQVAEELTAFPLNDTPFGLDWEHNLWPLPFRGALVVALHGSYYSSPQWQGARIVFAATDPTSHMPVAPFQPLVEGFGPGSPTLRRPADIAFSSDGRLFFADDHGNAVYWVAPSDLRMP